MSMSSLKSVALATVAAVGILGAVHTAPAFAEGKALTTRAGASIVNADADNLTIEVSKGTLIRLDRPATEVFVANPDVADVQVKSPRVIYIFGKRPGETSFYALDKNDKTIFSSGVAVSRNLSALRTAFKQMLPNLPIEVSALGQMTVLRGNVSAPDQAALAEKLAHSVLGTDKVLNNLKVLQPTQVNLRVRIAEISRSVLKQLGVNWENFYNGSNFGIGLFQGRNVFDMIKDPVTEMPIKQFVQPGNVSSLVGSITPGGLDLNYAIDALDTEGFLKVLAEPNLTALSGKSANFLAGGEFPIPVPSRDGIGIQYREFGVKLDFTPTVLNSGRISMRVRPEVSDLSTAGSIQIQGISVPSISTRRAETTIELGSGQSFAIAGLIQNNVTHDTTKLPGLGDIPILGALFKSDKFRHEETELLIVVTPYIVRPVSARKLMLPTDHYVAPNDMERYLSGKHWVPSKSAKTTSQDQAPGPSIKKRAGFQLD
ncbi:type II and III secretion system protein family protein [Kordiimonas marina]|uniref:type II and III secretion system protein family protein n=1 Tax=Kordiimonas marina TaxID=2872312 RepID=UPI001FF1F766|nr:type II and III secretion system protein family protein [Kordiimonas marina]MCJ9428587.1 type II and III secretion system protein family protein [Kordiimonas marina]